jgi:hypothetical protein
MGPSDLSCLSIPSFGKCPATIPINISTLAKGGIGNMDGLTGLKVTFKQRLTIIHHSIYLTSLKYS